MNYRKSPTDEQIDRINKVADAIAELLNVQPEDIRTDSSRFVSLTISQAERLVEMAQGY